MRGRLQRLMVAGALALGLGCGDDAPPGPAEQTRPAAREDAALPEAMKVVPAPTVPEAEEVPPPRSPDMEVPELIEPDTAAEPAAGPE